MLKHCSLGVFDQGKKSFMTLAPERHAQVSGVDVQLGRRLPQVHSGGGGDFKVGSGQGSLTEGERSVQLTSLY